MSLRELAGVRARQGRWAALTRARRRLADVPAVSAASVEYVPLPGGLAEVRARVAERSMWPISASTLGGFEMGTCASRPASNPDSPAGRSWHDQCWFPGMRWFLGLICLLCVTACSSPTGPSVTVDEQFTLAPGETARVDSTSVALTFIDVQGDSRCPADALCIQGGDAVVRVRGAAGSTTDTLELHTGDAARASAVFQGLRVALVELQPYPFSSRTIAPGDYRATLVVSRS